MKRYEVVFEDRVRYKVEIEGESENEASVKSYRIKANGDYKDCEIQRVRHTIPEIIGELDICECCEERGATRNISHIDWCKYNHICDLCHEEMQAEL